MAIKPTVRATSADVFSKGKNYVNIHRSAHGRARRCVSAAPEAFDVLGFCNGIDGSTLQRYREAELTHGRVSMLATVGFLIGEQVEGSSFCSTPKSRALR